MSRPLAIGLAQITGEPYAGEDNRRLSVRAATELFAGGAQLVVLPELIVPGYGTDPSRLEALAETLDGPTVTAWAQAAADAGGYLAGGICERDGDRLYDSAVLVGPEGVVLHYRKLHLFGEEKSVFAVGDVGLPVARTPFGVVGLCICYDLRFVETIRALSLMGAELVCVPTAWLSGFNSRRWDAEGLLSAGARGAGAGRPRPDVHRVRLASRRCDRVSRLLGAVRPLRRHHHRPPTGERGRAGACDRRSRPRAPRARASAGGRAAGRSAH